jgi:hypothetical protein
MPNSSLRRQSLFEKTMVEPLSGEQYLQFQFDDCDELDPQFFSRDHFVFERISCPEQAASSKRV